MVFIIQPTQVPKHPKVMKYFGISNINAYQNMRNKMKKKIVHEWWSRASGFQLMVRPKAVRISLYISSHKKQQPPFMLQSQGLAGTAASDDLQSPQVKASPNLKGQGPHFVHLP